MPRDFIVAVIASKTCYAERPVFGASLYVTKGGFARTAVVVTGLEPSFNLTSI